MNKFLNYIVLYFCLLGSVTLLAQKAKDKRAVLKNETKVISKLPIRVMNTNTPFTRKVMFRSDKFVWVYTSSTTIGHWERQKVDEKIKFAQLKKKNGDTLYRVNFPKYKIYSEAARHSTTIPKKAFEVEKIEEHPEWISKSGIHVKSKGDKLEMKGALGKTNVYYLKNINLLNLSFAGYNKYGYPETDIANTDHIIVIDTLQISPDSFGFMNIQRRNRGYIKIIANCIIYESPIKIYSVENKADFVFSADKFFLKSPYKDLTATELNTELPFIWKTDTNVEAYIDPFAKNEKLLMNRLMITFMIQIYTDLQNPKIDSWSKDDLLAKFQTYKGRVSTPDLVNDNSYSEVFHTMCNNFETKYDIDKMDIHRTINNLDVLVDGDVDKLPNTPFKYYAIPSKATLMPVKDPNTGEQNKLGNLYYKATGDSKMSVTIETKLGYDAIKFAEANQVLNEKGVILENNPPKKVISFSEQPLKANGETIGRILPISNQILRFEIDLPDENLSLIKLFLQTNNTFDLYYKDNQGQKEGVQTISLEIPEKILKQLDFTDLLNEFSVIEINAMTVTDTILITSNLWPVLEPPGEGALNYIEITLAFLFEDRTVFYQPERFSSHSVNGSKKALEFVKYSDDYKIIVSGTAYYEFGQRDIIKKNIFTNMDENIILQESMFKNNSLKN
ncbi:hypothetical protein [Winogradskyella forsetii]|uniref:hypothetical protein n=1 Tax=Winogradskyella forsetii TaxID=2686077 RepID=UPI0015BBB0B4|nr:hypothetical protein [Winogradskyella forsetii]